MEDKNKKIKKQQQTDYRAVQPYTNKWFLSCCYIEMIC
jgi:hypothetical protein